MYKLYFTFASGKGQTIEDLITKLMKYLSESYKTYHGNMKMLSSVPHPKSSEIYKKCVNSYKKIHNEAKPISINNYVKCILILENEVSDYMSELENYYIKLSKNIISLTSHLNDFFSKSSA